MTLAGMPSLFLKGIQSGRKHSRHFTVTCKRNVVSVRSLSQGMNYLFPLINILLHWLLCLGSRLTRRSCIAKIQLLSHGAADQMLKKLVSHRVVLIFVQQPGRRVSCIKRTLELQASTLEEFMFFNQVTDPSKFLRLDQTQKLFLVLKTVSLSPLVHLKQDG